MLKVRAVCSPSGLTLPSGSLHQPTRPLPPVCLHRTFPESDFRSWKPLHQGYVLKVSTAPACVASSQGTKLPMGQSPENTTEHGTHRTTTSWWGQTGDPGTTYPQLGLGSAPPPAPRQAPGPAEEWGAQAHRPGCPRELMHLPSPQLPPGRRATQFGHLVRSKVRCRARAAPCPARSPPAALRPCARSTTARAEPASIPRLLCPGSRPRSVP